MVESQNRSRDGLEMERAGEEVGGRRQTVTSHVNRGSAISLTHPWGT
jgi:hypothetical protein